MFRKRSRQSLHSSDSLKTKQVFSYHSSPRSTERSTTSQRQGAQETKKTLRYDFRQLPSLIALAVIVISIGYLLTLSSSPKIQAIDSQTGQYLIRKPEAYQEKAKQLMGSSPLNKLKLTIDTKSIETALKAEFPELKSVSVILPFMGRQPVIKLSASSPALVLESQNGSYIVNDSGIITMSSLEAGDLSDLELPIVLDKSTLEAKNGNGMLTALETAFIRSIHGQLTQQKLDIESIELPPIPNEVRFKLKNEPYYIRFNMQLDPQQSVGTYLAVRSYLNKNKTVPAQYIDARIEGRAYYR